MKNEIVYHYFAVIRHGFDREEMTRMDGLLKTDRLITTEEHYEEIKKLIAKNLVHVKSVQIESLTKIN